MVKTLIFGFSLTLLAFITTPPQPDPYAKLAWGALSPALTKLGNPHVFNLSVNDFHLFFRHHKTADFQALIKESGLPDDVWNSESQSDPAQALPAHMPQYDGGHLYRYRLLNGPRILVWTGENDAQIMRADYFFGNGQVMTLYKKSP